MYTEFYGLREKPFALLPDPRFLFLGRNHREALAHLLYGIDSGEGFIEVVGQVGTGKTTLCRTLLGRIGSDLEIAYIFNPSPSETELLGAICREFGLQTAVRSRTELIEGLNKFLLEKRAEDRRVLLVIDEAQNLEPAVLEQIRLLSNLETEREKLLQIVLVGQPELEENLARADLRQLRQRITVRWDLRPLDRKEVAEYLGHRLRVAGLERPDLFSPAACRALYRVSRGIPRVMNAVADRALLAGYSEGRRSIGAKTIRKVARELPASELSSRQTVFGLTPRAATALLVCGLVLGLFATAWQPGLFRRSFPAPEVEAGDAQPAVTLPAAPLQGDVTPASGPPQDAPEDRELFPLLLEGSSQVTAAAALDALLDSWGNDAPVAGAVDPNLLARTVRDVSSLKVFATRASLAQLERLNLPAILELEVAPGQRRYAALLGLGASGDAYLGLRERLFSVPANDIQRAWTGRTFFLWSNFESMPALEPGMNGSAVRWLQARLTDLGYLRRGDASGEFDAYTVSAIRRFQRKHALDDTGQVGPETLIALYQALSYSAPRLDRLGELS